jgi:hypothetical protein
VKRRPAPRNFLEQLPPWPRPLICDLRRAPELAVLAVLHTALRATLVALVAEHPTLAELGPPDEPPTLRRARRLVSAGLALGTALERYRGAAVAAFRVSLRYDDDLPF